MNAISILEKELKRVRKIGVRLAGFPKGSIPEKDLERYKKEVTENDVLEKDLSAAIITLRSQERSEKTTAPDEYGVNKFKWGIQAAIPAWDEPQRESIRNYEEHRREMLRRFEATRARMNLNWLDDPFGPTTGSGTFTRVGLQTPTSDADGEQAPND